LSRIGPAAVAAREDAGARLVERFGRIRSALLGKFMREMSANSRARKQAAAWLTAETEP